MKICSKCNESYDESCFYKQRQRKGGLHPWCKGCCKKHQRKTQPRRNELTKMKWKNDPEFREKRLELQRKWTEENLEYKRMKEKENHSKNPEPYRKRQKAYSDLHKEEMRIMARARQRVRYAIQRGELTRPDKCEWCGNEGSIEGAHYDYEKPLEVKWLCKPCHAKWDYHEPKIMRNKEAK